MTKSLEKSRDNIESLEAKVSKLKGDITRIGTDAPHEKKLLDAYGRLVREQGRLLKQLEALRRKNATEIESRKERTAVTVHDLKVPITVSLLNLELANMEAEDNEKQNYLMSVRRELEFLLDTISNLLDLEQQESIQITRQEVDLKEMLTGILDRLSVIISDKPELIFSTSFPDKLPPVQADRHKLIRVFNNLLSNAIKYTEAGSIKVSIELDRRKNKVAITVEDTGDGIEPDRLPNLFNMFEGDSMRHDSSGVGLAFVKLAVEAHGGLVSIKSKKGKGTSVTVRLAVGEN